MEFKLNDYHRNTPDQELLDDLKRVAYRLGRNNFTRREYAEDGNYGSTTITVRFGTWNKALLKAGLEITEQQNISNSELFENIEEVWIALGRQPKYAEIKQPLSIYSARTYENRFGSWRKALEAFVEFINTDDNVENEPESVEKMSEVVLANEVIFKHKTKRAPSDRLKVQVLMRDGNKCRLCGITLTGENIHFDHILAWSKGGETILENLQILCAQHNLAKGNLNHNAI